MNGPKVFENSLALVKSGYMLENLSILRYHFKVVKMR